MVMVSNKIKNLIFLSQIYPILRVRKPSNGCYWTISHVESLWYNMILQTNYLPTNMKVIIIDIFVVLQGGKGYIFWGCPWLASVDFTINDSFLPSRRWPQSAFASCRPSLSLSLSLSRMSCRLRPEFCPQKKTKTKNREEEERCVLIWYPKFHTPLFFVFVLFEGGKNSGVYDTKKTIIKRQNTKGPWRRRL